jgi:hypothetical protein
MSISYKCPHCNGFIDTKGCLLFSVKTPDHRYGLISLHTELGNYSVEKRPDFDYKEGDHLDFYCPICHAELTSGRHKSLIKIIMVDEQGREFEILFSRIAGKRSTYKIIGETMEIYGDDSAEYLDYINLSMNF